MGDKGSEEPLNREGESHLRTQRKQDSSYKRVSRVEMGNNQAL